jgi:hypothetical protein
MAKIVPIHDIGVPVPSPAPDPTLHLIVYYGPKGFTPDYAQTARIDVGALSALSTKTVGAVTYYDDPIGAELPANLAPGNYDFYFTFMKPNGSETDFSPVLDIVVDDTVPPRPGQPVQL